LRGAEYRKLDLEVSEDLKAGSLLCCNKYGIAMCAGEPVAIVGGGNSAGQATVFLSGNLQKVYLIIRGKILMQL
jgi:thioredoxin reductase (NADPH)